ncbi:MAG: ribonuclease R [Corallococcus sp.]|nr:ribonuclease R [Corallococcus sp.]
MKLKDKLVDILNNKPNNFYSEKQIYALAGATSKFERIAVKGALEELAASGGIVADKRNGRYKALGCKDIIKGEISGNQRGFAFVLREDGKEDLFVPHKKLNGAFHKDIVLVRRVQGTEDEAEVVAILQRGMTSIVGVYQKKNGSRFVCPDDKRFYKDVYIPPKKDKNAKNGQRVVVNVTVYPQSDSFNPEGEITQILGYAGEHNADMLAVAYSYGISDVFPEQTLRRADKLPQTVTESDIDGRRDLRHNLTVTIDGEDAKDLDDAVSCTANVDGTYNLAVHIADVSHYVRPSDDIDKEAFARGTSVYLPDMVFPMLPTKLSNGICSLYENCDRLTLSCLMKVDGKGNVTDFEVIKSVINSNHRMTYDQVQSIFDGDDGMQSRFSDVSAMLFAMQSLAEILIDKREKRGNVDFKGSEVKFLSDEMGRVVDIVPYQRKFSHRLIEEFMILANETVARYASDCEVPFVYRIHEKPEQEKLAALVEIMSGVGINLNETRNIHARSLADALGKARNTPYFNLINDVMLRTMQKARYSAANIGHFGLASECYCHFTSPIRRYPDLVVHRVLKTLVEGKMTEKAICAYEEMCNTASVQSSKREKIADEAERKADDVKKCQYAATLIGKEFDGIISGVIESGIFVELESTVEGFVDIGKLSNGTLTFDKAKFRLFGEGICYGLGDCVKVVIDSVNQSACKIDMSLASGKSAVDKTRAKRIIKQ